MSLPLSDAAFQTIADNLFLLRPAPAPPLISLVPLPKPSNNDAALAAKMAPIAANLFFNSLGIGVINFTDPANPKVWILNGDSAFRIASTAKLLILLSAIQLRDDVQKVMQTGLINTPADFDELFSIIWARQSDVAEIKAISNGPTPRISSIFDLTASPPDFNGGSASVVPATVVGKLPSSGHLTWATAPAFLPIERLWLAGARSDNVAATTWVSEIGVPYITAVSHAYGLDASGMVLFLGSGYASVNDATSVTTGGPQKYRKLRREFTQPVIDVFNGSHNSTQAGSAAGLTAYMLALMQSQLAGTGPLDVEESGTIVDCLSEANTLETPSILVEGVTLALPAGDTIITTHTKIGILNLAPAPPIAQPQLLCDFAFIQTATIQFAIVATGIQAKTVAGTLKQAAQIGRELGSAVFTALSGP
jgi:hypothetical protein